MWRILAGNTYFIYHFFILQRLVVYGIIIISGGVVLWLMKGRKSFCIPNCLYITWIDAIRLQAASPQPMTTTLHMASHTVSNYMYEASVNNFCSIQFSNLLCHINSATCAQQEVSHGMWHCISWVAQDLLSHTSLLLGDLIPHSGLCWTAESPLIW